MVAATTLRVAVDRDRCIASGSCVLTEPAVFEQDDEGKVVLLVDGSGPELRKSLLKAVDGCPASALRLVEE